MWKEGDKLAIVRGNGSRYYPTSDAYLEFIKYDGAVVNGVFPSRFQAQVRTSQGVSLGIHGYYVNADSYGRGYQWELLAPKVYELDELSDQEEGLL